MTRDFRLPRLAMFVLLCAACGLSAPASYAQESEEDAPRFFGGHQFVPSTVVPDPFISTTFTSVTGFGRAIGLTVPIFNIDNEQIGELSGNIGFMSLEFGYQQRIKSRFAVRVGANASARLGTTPEAILSEGVSALYGYGVGASANLLRKERWQLAATVDLRGNTLYSMSPLAFAQELLSEAGSGDSTGAVQAAQDTLLDSGDNLRVLGGLRGAYAASEWLGFTAFVEGGLGEKFNDGLDNTTVINYGASASVDLNPLTDVAIGLLGTYRRESLGEKGGDDIGDAELYGLGIFYTGRRFFSVGLENTWNQIRQLRADTKIEAVQARIVLRYDFR
jgi:hypothetical protein